MGEFLIILKGLLIIRLQTVGYHKPPFIFGNLPFFCFLNCVRAEEWLMRLSTRMTFWGFLIFVVPCIMLYSSQ